MASEEALQFRNTSLSSLVCTSAFWSDSQLWCCLHDGSSYMIHMLASQNFANFNMYLISSICLICCQCNWTMKSCKICIIAFYTSTNVCLIIFQFCGLFSKYHKACGATRSESTRRKCPCASVPRTGDQSVDARLRILKQLSNRTSHVVDYFGICLCLCADDRSIALRLCMCKFISQESIQCSWKYKHL